MANQYTGKHSWNEYNTELLKKLWAEGLTASHIAARIGGKVTRNSVLGKAHRLGIVIRGARTAKYGFPNKTRRKNRLKSAASGLDQALFGKSLFKLSRGRPRLQDIPPQDIPCQSTDIARKTLPELDDHDCRFIVGEPSGTGKCFCALPQVVGSKYCLSHYLRCTEAPKPKKPILEITADTSAPVKEGADA